MEEEIFRIYGIRYACTRMRMASYFSEHGIAAKNQHPDIWNPKRSIWLYDINDDFLEVLSMWYSERLGRKIKCVHFVAQPGNSIISKNPREYVRRRRNAAYRDDEES